MQIMQTEDMSDFNLMVWRNYPLFKVFQKNH